VKFVNEYKYKDFIATLDDTGQHVSKTIYDHIANHYPEYKPFDIRPTNKTFKEWAMNFRIKPKVGKALCTLYSVNGKLSMRVVFLGFMLNELLLKQNEFNDKIRRFILLDICKSCKNKCDYYQFRQHYYINNKLMVSKKMNCESREYSTEYAEIDNIDEDDINDIIHLIDLQTKHMTKDPREIRGNDYAETSKKRCGKIKIIELEQIDLDIDDFEQSDYADSKKLDKYATVYYLTPMGVYDGLWYYHNDKAVCGISGEEYCHTTVPEGRYASVTISEPFTFSAWRTWNYVAEWMRNNDVNIRQVDLGGMNVPYFIKFNKQRSSEYMAIYVPIE
jgi:hypothetical protein